jgi:predicted TIM-barrel fold metal-dependent hydrolase
VPRAIDVHVHPSTFEFVNDALGEYAHACEAYFHTELPRHSVQEMADEFRRADILGVLFAWDAETATRLPPVTNDFVAGCARDHPDAFLGFASVDPWKGDAAVVELERSVRDLGLRGLKLHPTAQAFRPDSRRVAPLWETAASLGIPVTVHTGTTGLGAGMRGGGRMKLAWSRPLYLDGVAADFPDLQIVMAHPAWPWQDEQLAVALHKPNTWIDLSGWSPRRFAPELVREIKGRLQDRVLFGTDYPFLRHEQWLGAFAELGLSDDITEKVLLRNAQRLLGL